jgi:hypothetical protein
MDYTFIILFDSQDSTLLNFFDKNFENNFPTLIYYLLYNISKNQNILETLKNLAVDDISKLFNFQVGGYNFLFFKFYKDNESFFEQSFEIFGITWLTCYWYEFTSICSKLFVFEAFYEIEDIDIKGFGNALFFVDKIKKDYNLK